MTKKLTITKKQAITECKELWEEIKASGLSKYQFLLHTERGERWFKKRYRSDCPLCEYVHQFGVPLHCYRRCPLCKKYGKGCVTLGYRADQHPSDQWMEAVRSL